LEQLVEEGIIPPLPPRQTAPDASSPAESQEIGQQAPTPPPPSDPGPQLPPGFRPRDS
jgi:hypothetical protein